MNKHAFFSVFSVSSIVILFALPFLFVLPLHAQSVVKPHFTCLADTCDGYPPHATDACFYTNLIDEGSQPMVDHRGATEAHIHLWYSRYNLSSGCASTWGSVYTDSTYMQKFTVCSYRQGTTDDGDSFCRDTWTFPNYNNHSWYDAGMFGVDSENVGQASDCMQAKVNWTDRDGYNISTYARSNGCLNLP